VKVTKKQVTKQLWQAIFKDCGVNNLKELKKQEDDRMPIIEGNIDGCVSSLMRRIENGDVENQEDLDNYIKEDAVFTIREDLNEIERQFP